MSKYITDPREPVGVLTKREYFAAMAMQGLHSDSTTDHLEPSLIAIMSVDMADALIAALNGELDE